MRYISTSTLLLLVLVSHASAQPADTYRIAESFAKDAQYHVICQVEIAGTLSVPATDKSPAAKSLKVAGKSAIQYDERILQLRPDRQVERTVRWYRQLEFERKVGDEDQHSKLRPEAHRLVILRTKQYEVPFCPTAPLLWSEIELVRTDVFVPALQGLFPTQTVRVGDRWRPDNLAIQELTDVEKIDQADFTCTLDKVTTLLGRRTAHVSFQGKVRGVGEDGNALHDLRGSYYFDLDANFLSYLYVKGTHHLLDNGGVIVNQLKRLGASCDWSRERFTMDEGLSRAVAKVFVELHREGLIYKDKRLVNWDPKLLTAISDLEVQQTEVKGNLWYLRYPIEGKSFNPDDPSTFIVVATTRPETMLGDTAVAVHPENERLGHLIGQHVILPLVGRRIPIIGDDYADPEKGSGAVKITPAHDFNDFEVGKRHGLPQISVLDREGCSRPRR